MLPKTFGDVIRSSFFDIIYEHDGMLSKSL